MANRQLPSPEVLRQLLRYNPETGRLFWKERRRDMFADDRAFGCWNKRFAGREAFTGTEVSGYRCAKVLSVALKAHRVAWAMHYGEWPIGHIDHINGSRSDNRIANLRLATPAENARNRRLQCNNSSGFKGVSWDAEAKKWKAHIKTGGVKVNLGRFEDRSDAARAYNAAARDAFGDFAWLNQVSGS